MRHRALSVMLAILAVGCAARGRNTPAAPTTRPAGDAPAPAIMKILKDLEAAGAKFPAIQADVDYLIDRMLTGETEQRTGYVKYLKRTATAPDKFRAHFDTLRMDGGRKLKSVVDWAFDGMWLTVARHRLKKIERYQVAAKGERVQPLRLSKGPFPLPFGQGVEDILEYFKVTQPDRKVSKKDPKNADYLKFTTLPARRRELSVVWIEQWIDRTTHLPVKIVAFDKSRRKTTVVFSNVKTDVRFSGSVFVIPRPRGWTESIKPLSAARRPGAASRHLK